MHDTYMPNLKRKTATTRQLAWRRTNMVHWRKHHKLTLEEVGERLGVTHATVSRWENGEHEPGAATLDKLAALYETDIHLMLNRLPGVPDAANRSETVQEICQLAQRISEPQRAIVLALLKNLSG